MSKLKVRLKNDVQFKPTSFESFLEAIPMFVSDGSHAASHNS